MYNDIYSRTRLLLGDAGVQKLKNSRVAVFGVGGNAAEALVRSFIHLFKHPPQCHFKF